MYISVIAGVESVKNDFTSSIKNATTDCSRSVGTLTIFDIFEDLGNISKQPTYPS